MEKAREKIEEALDAAYEELSQYGPGTKEYEAALKAVETITKLAIDEYRAEADVVNKEMDREITREKNAHDRHFKEKEAKRDILGLIVTIGTTALTSGLFVWAHKRTIRFEKTGVVTSRTYNSVTNLLPKMSNIKIKK